MQVQLPRLPASVNDAAELLQEWLGDSIEFILSVSIMSSEPQATVNNNNPKKYIFIKILHLCFSRENEYGKDNFYSQFGIVNL